MLVYKYDENYIYTQPEFYTHGIKNYTETPPPDGMFKAKWIPESQEWIESATKEYIDNLLRREQSPMNEMQRMQKTLSELVIDLVDKGVL